MNHRDTETQSGHQFVDAHYCLVYSFFGNDPILNTKITLSVPLCLCGENR